MKWYHNGTLAHTGNNFTTPVFSAPYVYTLKEYVWSPSIIGGKTNNSGAGSYYTFDNRAMLFDVLKPCVLRKVDVYAQNAGNRTFQLLNQYGVLITQKTVNLTAGLNTVPLDFDLPEMTQARLKILGTTKESKGITGEEQLREKLGMLYYQVTQWDGRPTDSHLDRIKGLQTDIDKAKEKAKILNNQYLASVNEALEKAGLPKIELLTREVFDK
jgi:hypothetical protein